MHKVIGAHFRKLGRRLSFRFTNLATAIDTDNPTLKWESIGGLAWIVLPRLIVWGIPAIRFARIGLLDVFIWLPIIVYSVGAIAASQESEAQPSAPAQPTTSDADALELRRAKSGLNNLLDIVMVAANSLAPETQIIAPATKDLLAYPTKSRCATLRDGSVIISVRLSYIGEIDSDKFKERFNNRMRALLDAGTLPGKPPSVFIDKETNIAYPSIQAVGCTAFGDYIVLDILRATPAAIPLLNALEYEEISRPDNRGPLYDDEL